MSCHRRRVLGFASALLVTGIAGCAPPARPGQLAPGSRLILLRHADRDGSDLSARGRARAAALPAALEGLPLDAIYSPGLQRNLDTAAPLAAARNLPVTRLPGERPAQALLQRGAGKSVLWVGNKGNLRSIWQDLGLTGAPPLDYGDLFIITALPGSAVRIERRHWGPA